MKRTITGRPLIFGHRGASRVAPENTLPAFERALEMGADGVELDVRYSSDGHLVVMHDPTLEETTDGHGRVAAHTLAELKALDAGSRFAPECAGTRIPTLDEALELMAGRGLVNIEIKSAEMATAGICRDVAAAVRRHKMADQVVVSSFNPFALRPFGAIAPEIETGYLTSADLPAWMRWPLTHGYTRAGGVHPEFAMVDAAFVAAAHGRHKAVRVWTVDEVPDLLRMAALGVDAIITNVPDKAIAVIEGQG